MKDGFEMIYNVKKPATAAGGLSSGLGNMVKGVAAGGAAWVAMTAVGAKEQGAKGAAKGFAGGFVAAVGLSCAGVATGGYQIGRGIANTPEAMREAAAGKEWDAEKREWVLYYLHEEEKEVLSISDDDFVADLKKKYGEDYGK